MAPNRAAIRQLLRDFDFRNLFVEALGWDRYRSHLDVAVGGRTFTLTGVAEKYGLAVYECQSSDGLPDYPTRRQLEREVAAKLTHEKLLVFTDAARTEQIWQWVKKEPGRPAAYREYAFRSGQPEELLVQKLDAIAFDLEEAERLIGVAAVADRVEASFDVDKVTKRFYERFRAEHQAFLTFIGGIEDPAACEWYASSMLHRLMFIYFFQRKGFLDGDQHYLRNRLRLVQQLRGSGQFLSFYRYFLNRLFHEGLGMPEAERDPGLDALLGRVPYLNGGLFDEHQIELAYPGIDIADEAFLRIFDFFDDYNWHLDERPLGHDREINPDVLGYIFEKYVNQKQKHMGAYYTREDITGYIAQNTVIPFLLNAAAQQCAIAFRPDGGVWRPLRDDPDRYIHASVRCGVDVCLPDDIAAGVGDVAQRAAWNRPAAVGYGLPTETWREHVERRQRCTELRRQLRAGDVHRVDDLVTLNLDLRRFAQDAIENAEGPELVRAFWHALTGGVPGTRQAPPSPGIGVLDPTCGSGAFLFAALSVLLPLYEACLQRMQRFVDEADLVDPARSASRYRDFRDVLARVAQHANPRYFVLKSIILENLYGVDIMDEAVETCKLRLFLKLVAQLDSLEQVEPLPDIDFNIRAGNTLVGFATRDQVRRALTVGAVGQMKMDASVEHDALQRIDGLADAADHAFRAFRSTQLDSGTAGSRAAKSELRSRLGALNAELDALLARHYRADKPFHWFVNFYGTLASGGFDVIIGNPPYLAYSQVAGQYSVQGYETQRVGNVYAFIVERCRQLLRAEGRCGVILPLSSVATANMKPFRDFILKSFSWAAVSFYHRRPGQLFQGALISPAILILANHQGPRSYFSTSIMRWTRETRTGLFERLRFTTCLPDLTEFFFPKFGHELELSIWRKLKARSTTSQYLAAYRDPGKALHYRTAGGGYWWSFLNYEYPSRTVSNKFASFTPPATVDMMTAVYNSTLFYWYYSVTFDAFNLKEYVIWDFHFDPGCVGEDGRVLEGLAGALMDNYRANAEFIQRGPSMSYTVYPKLAKPIIDQIDGVLARHYGFSAEELDFILNYDVKHRLGAGIDEA